MKNRVARRVNPGKVSCRMNSCQEVRGEGGKNQESFCSNSSVPLGHSLVGKSGGVDGKVNAWAIEGPLLPAKKAYERHRKVKEKKGYRKNCSETFKRAARKRYEVTADGGMNKLNGVNHR